MVILRFFFTNTIIILLLLWAWIGCINPNRGVWRCKIIHAFDIMIHTVRNGLYSSGSLGAQAGKTQRMALSRGARWGPIVLFCSGSQETKWQTYCDSYFHSTLMVLPIVWISAYVHLPYNSTTCDFVLCVHVKLLWFVIYIQQSYKTL